MTIPLHHKAIAKRKSILAGFKILAGITAILLLFFILLLVLTMAGNHFDKRLDEFQGEIMRLRWELENVREQQRKTDEKIDGIGEQQEEWLERFEVRSMEATAYTHVAVPGVADINGTGDGITASGLPVQEGIVAVDPRVIPLGTRVWVEGFGVLIAADTGGAIRGDRLDIFMDDKKAAKNFGRKMLRVFVIP